MRCTAIETGMRCNRNVKDGNSNVSKFCTEFHLCTFPGCEGRRVRRNGQDLQFCHQHRCEHDSCRNAKERGPFCRTHTCGDAHCMSFVAGGDGGDPERFCERHRRCLKPQCARFCHVRENGLPSPFCGAHYCEFADCVNERDSAAHCPEHTCVEPGCAEGREAAKALYCEAHGCRTKGCLMRRSGREHCPLHKCRFDACEAEAETNEMYCAGHQRWSDGGRERERRGRAMGGAAFAAYDDNYYDAFPDLDDRTRCRRGAERGTRYCDCRACEDADARARSSFDYNGSPRCAVAGCHRASGPGAFCEAHACSQAGCGKRVVDDTRWCFEHGRVAEDGYGLGADDGGAGRRRAPAWGERLRGRERERVGFGERRERRAAWGGDRGANPWAAWGITM